MPCPLSLVKDFLCKELNTHFITSDYFSPLESNASRTNTSRLFITFVNKKTAIFYKSVTAGFELTFLLFLGLGSTSVLLVWSVLCFLGLPRVTRLEATAMPGTPGGAQLHPPVGRRTIKESIAARLPAHGSRAIGLGRHFFRRFRWTQFGSEVSEMRSISTKTLPNGRDAICSISTYKR